jgi:hypothetical protein
MRSNIACNICNISLLSVTAPIAFARPNVVADRRVSVSLSRISVQPVGAVPEKPVGLIKVGIYVVKGRIFVRIVD